jgi:hypothetical protein
MTEITASIKRGAEIYGPDGIKKIIIALFHVKRLPKRLHLARIGGCYAGCPR